MSGNIVFEGWLTKSPPTKRIWRAKWRRRWFALRQSGELPGQYFLDYYAERNCRRLKGTINLDLCEQVDAGLHMKRGNGTLDSKIRGSVFTIITQSRTYHLEADCEEEMGRWVTAICKVCGLRSADDDITDGFGTYSPNPAAMEDRYENNDATTTGPYIPISQCITGVRLQDSQRSFTFDHKDRITLERSSKSSQMYKSQPQIQVNHAEFSENESNVSDEDCKSLNASHSAMDGYTAAKSFTKLAITPRENGIETNGPPVPPRPPKTFLKRNTASREAFHGPKLKEPIDSANRPWLLVPRRSSRGSTVQQHYDVAPQIHDVDEGTKACMNSMQYCNLLSMPPAVDRNLKPRYAARNSGIHTLNVTLRYADQDEGNGDPLQYLDLDLHSSKPPSDKPVQLHKRKIEVFHGKTMSAVDAESDYKTVDFAKTEAFNMTRQDAEASRNTQQ